MDRPIELLGIADERYDQANRYGRAHKPLSAQHEQTADDGNDRQAHIAQSFQHRRKRAGIGLGTDIRIAVGRIAFPKLQNVLLFATERLHLSHC